MNPFFYLCKLIASHKLNSITFRSSSNSILSISEICYDLFFVNQILFVYFFNTVRQIFLVFKMTFSFH